MNSKAPDTTLKTLLDSLPDVGNDGVQWVDNMAGSCRNVAEKRKIARVFRHFNAKMGGFGSHISERVVINEFWTNSKSDNLLEAACVFSLKVEDDMVNHPYQVLHGGCAAFLIDICCAATFIAPGLVYDHVALALIVTQSLIITWHAVAPLGTELTILTWATIFKDNRVVSFRCEIWDKGHNNLLASGSQTGTPLSLDHHQKRARKMPRKEEARL